MMSLNSPILGSSIVTATKEQVGSEVAGEAIILNLQSGMYYGLNPVGARIWHLIQEPKTVDVIRQTLLEEYAVEPEICDRDLQALLQELLSHGLVEVSHATAR